MLAYTIAVIFIFMTIFVIKIKFRYNYWKSKGVVQLQPHFLLGNFSLLKNNQVAMQELYIQYKAMGQKYFGMYMFTDPVFVPLDLGLIKNMFVKDFDHFMDREASIFRKEDPLSGHLLMLKGEKWKAARAQLTPTFTSGKMKMMFQIFVECSKILSDVPEQYVKSGEAIDIKDLMARFTTDIIGNCAFGIECNSINEPGNEFLVHGRKIFEMTTSDRILRLSSKFLPTFISKMMNLTGFPLDTIEFFKRSIAEIVEYREKNNVMRKDFLNLLIQLKNHGKVTDDEKTINETPKSFMTISDIMAHSFVFFLAGFETSSTTMSFALYELAINQHVQDQLRIEINEVLKKYDNNLTYEAIADMVYLDKVIKETLRMHPAVGRTSRICTKEYKVPGTNVVLEKGTSVHVSILGLHTDPEYFPNPEIFDPERFNEENKHLIPASAYIPFGEGPRNCIGMRFGLLQTKIGLVTMLKNHKYVLNNKTKVPFEMDPHSVVLSVLGGIWLNIEKA